MVMPLCIYHYFEKYLNHLSRIQNNTVADLAFPGFAVQDFNLFFVFCLNFTQHFVLTQCFSLLYFYLQVFITYVLDQFEHC